MKVLHFFLLLMLFIGMGSCDESTEISSQVIPVSIPNDATFQYSFGILEDHLFTQVTQEATHASLSQLVTTGEDMTFFYKALEDFVGMDYVQITFYARNNDGTIYTDQLLRFEINVTEKRE